MVDCIGVEYVGFGDDENYEEIHANSWKARIRAPMPHLRLYGLSPLKMKDPQDITRIEIREFTNYGFVGSHLQAIEAVEEQIGLNVSVAASLANPHMRQLAIPFKQLRRNGPHLPGMEPDEHQRDAIDGMERDVEAIQGPPGTGKSTMICSLLLDYLPDRCSLVTSVQNKALDAIVSKLDAVGHASFLVAGGRSQEQQQQLKVKKNFAPMVSLGSMQPFKMVALDSVCGVHGS